MWTSHGLDDTSEPQNEAISKASGLTPPNVAVTSSSIIERLDVIKDIGSCQVSGFIYALLDTLLFQAAEERFGNGVIPAVTTTAHAR